MKNTNTTTGNDIVIRPLRQSDWHPLWVYINQISREQTYISFQGERITQQQEKAYVSDMVGKMTQSKALVLVITIGQQIIGTAHLTRNERIQSHVADLGISIHKDYRHQGLGKRLLQQLISMGKSLMPDINIVTLQLFANNQVALKLYNQLGFRQLGRMPKGYRYQGDFVDAILMYKNVEL